MSLNIPSLSGLQHLIAGLKNTNRGRLTTVSISLGLALIGILAMYYRRRRGKRTKKDSPQRQISADIFANHRQTAGLLPNGDLMFRANSPRIKRVDSLSSATRSLTKDRSLHSSTLSLGAASSTDTITFPVVDTSSLAPGQLCNLGFEALQTAVHYWEDARVKLQSNTENTEVIESTETAELLSQLDDLLQSAYRIIDSFERHADHVAFDSALLAFTEADKMSSRRSLSMDESSDQESFVSATDMANLSDLENHREMCHHLPLYEAGLLELKYGSVPCRSLRTEMTGCLSDTEFLAKLHGIRLAMDVIFKAKVNKEYFSVVGQKILGNFLIKTQRDPEDFYTAYSDLIEYVSEDAHWTQIEDELKSRGVKCMNFYDIVLDFIMMDAFDDLDNPPSSVISVVQNRWLTNGFKETALSTACWSVLKAKKRLLKYANGFISRFYAISEHTSPVLAWGFMGPESELKNMCMYFKELILGFIQDMFSFEKSSYTTVEELAEDILKLAKSRSDDALVKLGC